MKRKEGGWYLLSQEQEINELLEYLEQKSLA